MKNQSAAKIFTGWNLVAGLIILVTITLTLDEISENIIKHQPITVADAELSMWLHSHATPWLTKSMFVATSFGSTPLVICLAIAFGIFLIWRRHFYWLAALASTVPGGGLLNKLLKYAFQRPRPVFTDPILSLNSYSFPSGHTMMATVMYGLLAAYALSRTTNRVQRILIVLTAGLLIMLVGFSRMYLGAHYLTDVLAAMAEGLAWLALCLALTSYIWRRAGAKTTG